MTIRRLIEKELAVAGGLSQVMDNFEDRPEQRQMALAVWDALEAGSHLLVEAGTGVGKSLAYLLPASLWSLKENKKVLVATGTKILQTQLIHHLFFAHLQTGYNLLPQFAAVVFDEAHRLEEVAAASFGFELSSTGLALLLSALYNAKAGKGFLTRIEISENRRERFYELIQDGQEQVKKFFSLVRTWLDGEEKKRVQERHFVENILDNSLKQIGSELAELHKRENDENLAFEIEGYARRVERRRAGIANFLELADSNSVYWIERAERDRVVLRSALLEVGEVLRKYLFEVIPTAVLTSATLAIKKDFSFTSQRLGLDQFQSLLVASPFNYEEQALIYISPDLPLPTEEEIFYDAAARRIKEMLEITRGRALVLFTSFRALEAVYDRFLELDRARPWPEHFTILCQGDGSRQHLLNQFKNDIPSVLFATQSFWQGVDVPGEALLCLIITRLPFDVPDDPRVEAIVNRLHGLHQDPFTTYQLPQAVLRLCQGFGRLIRSQKDFGVVCILDKRVVKKWYGQVFLAALPSCPITCDVEDIKNFFNKRDEKTGIS